MIPVQMIRVGVGDETIHVPVFRLPYVGGRDAFATLGGFFVTSEGDYGVAVDGAIADQDVSAWATAEIRTNLPRLTALVQDQFARLSGQRSSSAS